MKNVRDEGFSRKRGGNAGSGPPAPPTLPDPRNSATILDMTVKFRLLHRVITKIGLVQQSRRADITTAKPYTFMFCETAMN